MIEIEKKYKVSQERFDSIQKAMDESAALFLGEYEEQNVLYTGNSVKAGEVYRLRKVSSVFGNVNTVFTFKRKLSNELGLKQYKEIEFSVTQPIFERFLVEGLELYPSLVYEKKRQEYKILKGTVCFDVLPFGTFIEIEAPEKVITVVEKEYELQDFIEQKTYPDLTQDFGVLRDGIYQARFLQTL
jgi:adenylate cyclase class 2